MELVLLLRVLWRHRVLVAVGLAASAALGLGAGLHAPARSAVASSRVMLDTPRSQLVHVDPAGAGSLQWRATMLAHLMTAEPVRAAIARRSGVPVQRLAVVDPSLVPPPAATTLGVTAADAAAIRPEPDVVTIRFDPTLPIVSVEARAKDAGAAVRLADAATDVLVSRASPAPGPLVQGSTVTRIAPTEAHGVLGTRGRALALVLAVLLSGAWCLAIAVADAARGARRRRRARLVTG